MAKWTIPILIGSIRRGRQSPKAARFIKARLEATGRVSSPFLDLLDIGLPVMEERLSERDDPPPGLVDLSRAISGADALVIVTPEYNNGIPGALKNALDYLYDEFSRKPVGVVTISGGPYGGVNCLAQLRPVLLTMGAYPIAEKLPIPRIDEALSEDGVPMSPSLESRAKAFIDELLWLTERFASGTSKPS
jgi:NAD(P)H-dependent FMN reductase